VTERELLAKVYSVQYFRQYLLGRKFIVRSDHKALVWLFCLKEPNGKTVRWIEILAAINFSIQYLRGKFQLYCEIPPQKSYAKIYNDLLAIMGVGILYLK
jgi:hypothetical protein